MILSEKQFNNLPDELKIYFEEEISRVNINIHPT